MKTVVVVGAKGKMGSVVCDALEGKFLVKKIDLGDRLEDVYDADLVIDFATHESSVRSAQYCASRGIGLIVGSTGQSPSEMQSIVDASKNVPVLVAGNFSVGIYLLKKMLCGLVKIKNAEFVVFEKHHSEKVDSPSGTALELSEIIKEKTGRVPQTLSERGGKEIGTHQVDIYFGDEVLKISHQAFSRKAFAQGVELAVDFLTNKHGAGLFGFEDAIKGKGEFL